MQSMGGMYASELIHALSGMDMRRDQPSEALWGRMERAATPAPMPDGDITFWTYRCADAKPEVYGPMIEHWGDMAFKFHRPSPRVIVSEGHELNMFQRAIAMCAFVHSSAFNSLTVFMDNDAFPNADLRDVPIDKIGLTERQLENFMPINEGVIFARPSEEARAFFRAYVGTFENLVQSISIEGKGVTWWGGQIALNLIRDMPGVTLLPCDTWNFSPEAKQEYTWGDLDSRRVIHIKGKWWKQHFAHVKRYQEARCV